MFGNLSETGKAWVYAGLVCTLALFAAVTIRALEVTSELAGAVVYMFTPTLAVLLMLLVVTRDGWSRAGWSKLGLRRSRRRTWPLAAGTTFLASLVASVVVWLTPLAGFHAPGRVVDELINFVINVVLMTLTLVLGEELGWRGYLLPRLRGIGRGRSLLTVGLVHAAWHLPLVFLTPPLPRAREPGSRGVAAGGHAGRRELRVRIPAAGHRECLAVNRGPRGAQRGMGTSRYLHGDLAPGRRRRVPRG